MSILRYIADKHIGQLELVDLKNALAKSKDCQMSWTFGPDKFVEQLSEAEV